MSTVIIWSNGFSLKQFSSRILYFVHVFPFQINTVNSLVLRVGIVAEVKAGLLDGLSLDSFSADLPGIPVPHPQLL